MRISDWSSDVCSSDLAAIVGLLTVWLWRARLRSELVALSLIIGGASGNLIDRLHDGAVTDFLDFYVGRYHWPAFNGAAPAITLGVLCLLFSGLRPARTPPLTMVRISKTETRPGRPKPGR